jgi:hypothetical protein
VLLRLGFKRHPVDPSPPLRWLTPLAHRTSVHRSGSARRFRPYPPQTPTQRPPVRVLPLPILTRMAYLGSELRFPPTSFTSSFVFGRTRSLSVTWHDPSMEAGREQRMIEIDRSPSQFCSKECGLALAAGCHRARLHQGRGRPRGHEKGLGLLDLELSRFVIFRVTSSCV